jgi:NitT/TauT family transport system permease protein
MCGGVRDLHQPGVERVVRLTKWQRFWGLDVPGGMIPLVWNGMMGFGGGSFFLVTSDVIGVNHHLRPCLRIGSYVAAASQQQQLGRLLLAIGVMIVMVIGVNPSAHRACNHQPGFSSSAAARR